MATHRRTRLTAIAGVVGMMAAALAAPGTGTSSASPALLSSSTTALTFIDDSLSWPSLDPASSVSEGTENPVYSLIYGNLFTVGPGGKAVPGLATGYHFSSNNLTFTLDIRPGVKFQDGTPF